MDNPQRFWNIFQSILNSIGSAPLQNPESQSAILHLFENILTEHRYAESIVRLILAFIDFAWRAYRLIRSFINGSRPVAY